MHRASIFFTLAIVSAALAMVTTCVRAETLVDLEPPLETYQGGSHQGEWRAGVEDARSFIFEDVAPFELLALEMLLNPLRITTFTAELWSVVGQDSQGTMLTQGQDTLGDAGRAFFHAPISYSFPGNGDRYLLAMSWSSEPTEAVYYSFEGFGDFSRPIDPPYVRGPLRIIDGKGGSPPIFSDNFVISHFRVALVPEPGTICLAGFGIVGLTYASRWRRVKSGRRLVAPQLNG